MIFHKCKCCITYYASQVEALRSVFSIVPCVPQPDNDNTSQIWQMHLFKATCSAFIFSCMCVPWKSNLEPFANKVLYQSYRNRKKKGRRVILVTCCSSIFWALSWSCCLSSSSFCFWRSAAFWFKSCSCLTKCSSNSLISSSVYAWFCSRVWGHHKTQNQLLRFYIWCIYGFYIPVDFSYTQLCSNRGG